jgi:hypothetical protein
MLMGRWWSRGEKREPSEPNVRRSGRVLQGRSVTGETAPPVPAPPVVEDVVSSPGHPLDPATRVAMELSFGHDFSKVRVHSDESAGDSAVALDADAYTVGDHIAFAPGRLKPDSAPGRALIAHELTHVVQQSGTRGDAVTVGESHATHEHEAQSSARAVAEGRPVPHPSPDRSGVVRRSIFGGILGGIVGAVGGALLGSLLGPVGAIVGGVVGGLAGVALGDVATSPARPLSSTEKTEAEIVFGTSLDLDEVTVAEAPIMASFGYARTLPGAIYFPPGTFSLPRDEYMPWLIHELTHAWQYQHGITVWETIFHAIRAKYDYGGEAGLVTARREGKRFRDFNTEQQARICEEYYKRQRDGLDTSAWDPYIAEVKGTVGSLTEYPL